MAEHHGDARRCRAGRHRRRLCDALPRPRGSRARHHAHVAPGTPAIAWYRGRAAAHGRVSAAAAAHERRGAQVVPQATRVHYLSPAVRFAVLVTFFFWLTTHGHHNRNLTRLALLAQRVREDPDPAYRCTVTERLSQFVAKV